MKYCYDDKLLNININEYDKTIQYLYSIFKDCVLHKIKLNNKPIEVREYPPEGKDKEEAFYHLTETDYCGDLDNRYLDTNRCIRLKLIKPIIENVNNCPLCENNECSQILLWKEIHKKRIRYKLFLTDMSYIVVLEDRKTYYLLITAFYVYPETIDTYYNIYEKNKIDYIK